jgi:hypothetical protein
LGFGPRRCSTPWGRPPGLPESQADGGAQCAIGYAQIWRSTPRAHEAARLTENDQRSATTPKTNDVAILLRGERAPTVPR